MVKTLLQETISRAWDDLATGKPETMLSLIKEVEETMSKIDVSIETEAKRFRKAEELKRFLNCIYKRYTMDDVTEQELEYFDSIYIKGRERYLGNVE